MKQTKLWLATIAALLCSLTASAHDFEVNGIYYNITSSTDLTVAVTYKGSYYHSYSNEYTGAVIIPKTVTYNSNTYRVTSIGEWAFYGCSSLTSITIPEGVTSIGEWAFYDCSSLTSITIPEGVTSIGEYAFYDCSSLTSITIPEGVPSIGYRAFEGCRSLTSITIPESVTEIGEDAFHGCSSLTSITIPESVTEIGNYAFEGCTSLKEVIIEDGSTTLSLGYNYYGYGSSVGQGLFYDCPLETVYLGRNLSYSSGSSFGYFPFYNKTKLTSVTIGDSVTSIGEYAFRGCSSLPSITIPEGVTSIGEYAFYGCSSLTSITIPGSVTEIGGSAFYGCSSLTFFTIPDNSKLTSIGYNTFRDCSSLTSITIPESVTEIGNYAFDGCTSLKEVIIEDGSTTLSLGYNGSYDGLFYDCPLETVYLGRNLSYNTKASNYSPFYYRTKLTSVTIGDNVTEIGSAAFCGCSSLPSITIPEGVTSIGNYAFVDCSSLTSITIPEGVTSIGGSAFEGCSSLTSINIPEGVTSIGNSAFEGCSSLTFITIPESVTSIGSSAFRGCSSLPSITIPESVTEIGSYAFYNCSNLYRIINNSSLALSKGSSSNGYVAYYAEVVCNQSDLTTVGDFQFYTSNGIHFLVNYIGEDTEIVLPDCYNGESYNIEIYAFSGCNRLTSIVVAEGNTVYDSRNNCNAIIETSTNTLIQGCASTVIPEGVTSIGDYAFRGCSSLTSITLPESVNEIGSYAFQYCYSLYKVINNSNLSLSEGSSSNGYVAYYAKVLYEGSDLTTVGDFQFYTSDGIHSLVNYIGEDTEIMLPDCYNGESYNIGSYAFHGCSSLPSITIPESVASIENYAFDGCSNLHSVTIGSGVLFIGSSAFSTPKKVIWLTNTPPTGYANAKGSINYVANDQYTSLSNVKVYPYLSSMFEVDGVKYVPVSPAERTCDAIDCAYDSTATVINVSETASFKGIAMTVKEVMPYAFYGNKHIKEVSASHKGNIGDYAFYDCDSIQSVELSNEGDVGNQAFYNCGGIINVVASNKGDINSEAFYDCDGIQSVELSNEGNVGNQAFYSCDGMLTATISNQGDIESQAFYDCDSLKTLNISNIGNVGNEAFRGCGALETAIVTNTGAVNSSAFYDCVSLKSVTLGDKVTSLGNDAFRGCTSLQEIVIPDSVRSVGTYCFYGCTAMKSAVIGDGLTNVEGYTFANCSGLDSVKIGNGVTAINGYAFKGCSSLKDIEFGDSVATINNNAFQGCSSLPIVTIPQTVTRIGNYAFSDCSSLADVIIADRTTALALGSNGSSSLFIDCPLDSVYIGGQITYSTSPFYRNTSLRTAVISDRETQVYANEFFGCTALKNVTIGNGVSGIGDYAFSGCSSLEGFSFGSNMERIGAEAFSDCTNLTSITSHAAVPPTCGTQALDDINKWSCTLRVPSGYASAYMAADQWKDFFFIEAVVEVDHYILTFMVDGEVYHTEVLKHKDEVTMPDNPTKVGYEFGGWSDTLTVMPAEDVTISGTFVKLPVENFIIRDSESSFILDEELECDTVTYIRTFDDTEWQALYVPFEIPYDSVGADFEVAYINDVRQYDTDNDGAKDETVIEAFKMTGGTLEANYPYLIRAKEAGEKSIIVPEAMLYTTEENSIDCSSVYEKFTFTGTYSSLSSAELPEGEGYYTLVNGEWQSVTENVMLGAFRFYLKVDSRSGSTAAQAQSIRMLFVDEEGNEEGSTRIDDSEFTIQNSQIIYDLSGRKIVVDDLRELQKGVYIINGRKVVVK